MNIAIQLYTLRNSYENKEEFKAVLRKVKELGYDGVEFAGYGGFEAEELNLFLKEINLIPLASHHPIKKLDTELEAILEFDTKVGCRYVVCSYAPTSTMEELKYLKQVMKCAKTAIKFYPLELAYHNHTHEFIPLPDGTIPMDEIKEVSRLEVDTYWVFQAHTEPCHYLLDNAKDISLVHIKDGDFNANPLALGEGNNNIKGILEASKEIGMEWIIVENDFPKPDGLSDVARSIRYLKQI